MAEGEDPGRAFGFWGCKEGGLIESSPFGPRAETKAARFSFFNSLADFGLVPPSAPPPSAGCFGCLGCLGCLDAFDAGLEPDGSDILG